jgi:hypothetical protein
MVKSWQRKHQREIENRLAGAWRTGWARSLCQLHLWYAQKQGKEAPKDAKAALEAIQAGCVWKLSINRAGDGFKLETSSRYGQRGCFHISTYGLPALPPPYVQEA